MKRLILIALPLAALLVFGAGRMVAGSVSPHFYAGTILQDPAPAPSLSELEYTEGDSVELAAYDGELVLLYFGYTSCPDVCPTTLSGVATALDELSDSERDRVNLIMISVDPERDTQSTLENYVEFFDPTFLGATGSRAAIDAVAAQYGIFYEFGEPTDGGWYPVDHTTTLLGISPEGSMRIVWPPGVTADQLTQDMKELLQ